MKRFLLVALSLLLLTTVAEAFDMDEERHYRTAAELLEVLDMEKRAEQSVEAAVGEYLQLHPDKKGREEAVRAFYGKYIGWAALENDLLDLFTGEFSEKEIREMTEFYTTAAGKKASAMIDTLYNEGVASRMKKAEAAAGDLGGKPGVK